MTEARGVLGAPFFIAERGKQSEGAENLCESLTAGDLGFGFDAMFVQVLSGAGVGKALMGQGPVAGIVADTQDFSAGAQLAVGRVIQDVAFKRTRGLEAKSGRRKTLMQV